MAKAPLKWTNIEVTPGNTDLHKAIAAEQAAVARVNGLIAAAVSAKHKVPAGQVRVGRVFGRLSYAIDLAAADPKPATETF